MKNKTSKDYNIITLNENGVRFLSLNNYIVQK